MSNKQNRRNPGSTSRGEKLFDVYISEHKEPKLCGLLLDDGKSPCGKPATVTVVKFQESADESKGYTKTPICSECAQDNKSDLWVLDQVRQVYHGTASSVMSSASLHTACERCGRSADSNVFIVSPNDIKMEDLCNACMGGASSTRYLGDAETFSVITLLRDN